jgi:hypothetical protein
LKRLDARGSQLRQIRLLEIRDQDD